MWRKRGRGGGTLWADGLDDAGAKVEVVEVAVRRKEQTLGRQGLQQRGRKVCGLSARVLGACETAEAPVREVTSRCSSHSLRVS